MKAHLSPLFSSCRWTWLSTNVTGLPEVPLTVALSKQSEKSPPLSGDCEDGIFTCSPHASTAVDRKTSLRSQAAGHFCLPCLTFPSLEPSGGCAGQFLTGLTPSSWWHRPSWVHTADLSSCLGPSQTRALWDPRDHLWTSLLMQKDQALMLLGPPAVHGHDAVGCRWLLDSTGLRCTGPLIHAVNTPAWRDPRLVESKDAEYLEEPWTQWANCEVGCRPSTAWRVHAPTPVWLRVDCKCSSQRWNSKSLSVHASADRGGFTPFIHSSFQSLPQSLRYCQNQPPAWKLLFGAFFGEEPGGLLLSFSPPSFLPSLHLSLWFYLCNLLYSLLFHLVYHLP